MRLRIVRLCEQPSSGEGSCQHVFLSTEITCCSIHIVRGKTWRWQGTSNLVTRRRLRYFYFSYIQRIAPSTTTRMWGILPHVELQHKSPLKKHSFAVRLIGYSPTKVNQLYFLFDRFSLSRACHCVSLISYFLSYAAPTAML